MRSKISMVAAAVLVAAGFATADASAQERLARSSSSARPGTATTVPRAGGDRRRRHRPGRPGLHEAVRGLRLGQHDDQERHLGPDDLLAAATREDQAAAAPRLVGDEPFSRARARRRCGRPAARSRSRASRRPADAPPRGAAHEILSFRKEERRRRRGGLRPARALHGAHVRVVGQIMQGYRPARSRRSPRRRGARRCARLGATWRVGSSAEERRGSATTRRSRPRGHAEAAGIEPDRLRSPSPSRRLGCGARHRPGAHAGCEVDRPKGRTPRTQGLRTSPTGPTDYIDGKRCLKGDPGDRPDLEQAPAARRQVLAAGDADTDVTMVRDATGVHIASTAQPS